MKTAQEIFLRYKDALEGVEEINQIADELNRQEDIGETILTEMFAAWEGGAAVMFTQKWRTLLERAENLSLRMREQSAAMEERILRIRMADLEAAALARTKNGE